MANVGETFFTGVGIMVQGDPFYGSYEGYQGVKRTNKDGTPREEFFIAVAFPKDQPAATKFEEFQALMQATAATHANAAQLANYNWQGFSWKLEDGDSMQNVNKPGFAGCWIVKMKNGFAPQVFDENKNVIATPYDVIDKPDLTKEYRLARPANLKKGHYVRCMVSVEPNKSAPPQAGLYINVHMVQRVGYGPEIVSGPDYSSMMSNEAVPQLAGMSAMPVGGAAPVMNAGQPGMPGAAPTMPGMPGATTVMPGMPGAAPTMPGAAPTMPGAVPAMPGMPPAAPAAPAAPAVETPQQRMLVTDFTYQQYIDAGYNDEMLIANGKMRAATTGGHPYNA